MHAVRASMPLTLVAASMPLARQLRLGLEAAARLARGSTRCLGRRCGRRGASMPQFAGRVLFSLASMLGGSALKSNNPATHYPALNAVLSAGLDASAGTAASMRRFTRLHPPPRQKPNPLKKGSFSTAQKTTPEKRDTQKAPPKQTYTNARKRAIHYSRGNGS